MEAPILKVKNISKHFGGVLAVQDMSFEVAAGEVVGLMGPNGAGKSTLLNLIAGNYKADAGQIIFRDKDITGMRPYQICRLGMARTYQIPQPFTHLSPRANMHVAARYGGGMSKAEADLEATKVLNMVSCMERDGMVCEEMATIALKRLELARALASRPVLLLLDEVAAGSTEAEIPGILSAIKEIQASGKTIILVEHVMKVLLNAVDRLIVMDKGAKIAEGPPAQVMENKKVIEAYLG